MAESFNQQTALEAEEVLRTEIIFNQALIDILIAKKIITADELVNTIRNIRHEQEILRNESSKIVSLR
jgi:hypothetical protein